MNEIKTQGRRFVVLYGIFAIGVVFIMFYYLSDTLIHFTTPYQFPINSFSRFPLTFLIFPAEIFSFLFSLYFIYNLLNQEGEQKPRWAGPKEPVAILIPVYNEPREIVDRTLRACNKLRWHDKVNVYLLDDSTDEEDKKNMALLARRYGAIRVTRKDRVGYKAGNVNNAIKNEVKESYFVILDSDQAPHPEFLEETMPYFKEKNVGFVQAPQHFIDERTVLERAAKIGTNIFYRAQCVSKSNDGAIPFCGTNVVVRRDVFLRVGGLAYYTATEDIDLGIRMNAKGYVGKFVPKVLVEGYTPPDFKAYVSQQYRWANGNLAILRENWKRFLFGNFPMRYQMHMLVTTGWWLVGFFTLLYIFVPILAAFFGWGTHHTWLPSALFAYLFVHVALGISVVYASQKYRIDGEQFKLSDALLQYSLITNSLFIYSRAAWNALVMKRYVGFVRTNKKGSASGLWLIKWNLALGALSFVASLYTLYYANISGDIQQLRTYLPLSLWLLFYSVLLFSSILFVGKRPRRREE